MRLKGALSVRSVSDYSLEAFSVEYIGAFNSNAALTGAVLRNHSISGVNRGMSRLATGAVADDDVTGAQVSYIYLLEAIATQTVFQSLAICVSYVDVETISQSRAYE